MKKIPSIIATMFFLLIGIMIFIYDTGSHKWYTGITFLFIGSLLLRRVMLSNNEIGESGVIKLKERAFRDNPIEASLLYFFTYFGGLSLLNDVRVPWGYEKLEGGPIYLLSLGLVLTTYYSLKSKSSSNKSDA